MDCSPPGFSVLGDSQARILEWVSMPSSKDIPNPGIKPRSPALQVDSLPIEPPGKPQNTGVGVGSHFLLQGIFPTQGWNLGLSHCRWILYHLSHQGSPRILEWVAYLFSRGSSCPGSLNQGLLHCRWILYQLSYQLYLWTLNFEFNVVLMCYMFFF